MCKFGKKVGRLRVNYRHADNTFLTSDLSSLSSKSFRFVANVDGEAQMTEAETIEEAEAAAAVFDELEVAIWGCCSQLLLWFPTEQWRLDEVEVATAKIGESCKIEKEIEFLNSGYTPCLKDNSCPKSLPEYYIF